MTATQTYWTEVYRVHAAKLMERFGQLRMLEIVFRALENERRFAADGEERWEHAVRLCGLLSPMS